MAAASNPFRLFANLVHFFLICFLTVELTNPRKENLSKDMFNGASGIQTGQELCKPVITVHKDSKPKSSLLSANKEKFQQIVGLAILIW